MISRFTVFLALAVAALAAPVTRDLGEGLSYIGVAALTVDLPAAGAGPSAACVLDLRYATGGETEAAALGRWLKARARPSAPVFVLANAETSFALRLVLIDRTPGGGVMVLGVAGPGFEPDIAISVSAAQEKAAWEALRDGTALEVLLRENRDKVRNDEASLLHDRPAVSEGASTAAKPPSTTVIDVTLQRAVHVHRTLVAMKRI